jgi:ABC-type molybdenum transport system, ATPase component/photorepair protein PhrA
MNAIELSNVSVVRDGSRILDNVNVTIGKDENVAIIGPNGSGKTTLMKLLRGEILPYYDENVKTTFRLFGKDRWNLFELRSRIGIVSMDLQSKFDENSRIGDIVMSGFFSSMDVYRNHSVTMERKTKAEEMMELLDISDKTEREAGKISLGEMRRTLIARALVNDPEMLVLDEPMTGLDVSIRAKFRKMFDRLIAKNVSIVMITHELEDIPKDVTRVIMIKNGRIFADGPKEKMLVSKTVSELYDMDVRVTEQSGSYHMITE